MRKRRRIKAENIIMRLMRLDDELEIKVEGETCKKKIENKINN